MKTEKVKDNSRATIYFGEELGAYLENLTLETGLKKSEIICEALRNHKIVILAEGAEIAKAFVEICNLISRQKEESQISLNKNIERELENICKLLESLIVKISQNDG